MVEIAFDTDIGSDVDDLLALAMILGSPEWDLQAVTTVYGDTVLRARMVRGAYRLAGRSAPPIAAGAREARSGRPVWWAGHEGALMPGLTTEPVDESLDESLDAVALLRGSRVVVAVGPLTNVAEALEGSHDIEQLVVMGGDLRPGEPEHNVLCDVAAAQAVFVTGLPAVVTGIDQTERVVLTEAQLSLIEASGELGKLLVAEIRQFRSWLGRPDSPHDPVAVLAAIRPDLFTFARGWIRVSTDGRTVLERHGDGPHRMVVDLDTEAVADELVTKIRRIG
ncbi:nucleoside hydrolase [Tenggerimyces flavus]|uniref:Nucleoside hydrolase n=1 Tax=Tenggerimyces flavus TaxID=1708749 RepID=A0ABV7Y3H9_9ACTN|nr:nucleoside hydrolase [Tenggerimyces flavus]MBM7790359.1 purine nucleosidase [Tenggerimyces flavus]